MRNVQKMGIDDNFRSIVRAFKTIANCSRLTIPAVFIRAALSSLAPFATLYLSARILDLLLADALVSDLTLCVMGLIGINLVTHVLVNALNGYLNTQNLKLGTYSGKLVADVILHTDYINFEKPEFMNKKRDYEELAHMYGDFLTAHLYSAGRLVESIFPLFFAIALTIPMFKGRMQSGGFLSSPWISVIVIVAAVLPAVVNFLMRKRLKDSELKMVKWIAENNRMSGYYMNSILDYRMVKEIKLYRAQRLINNDISEFLKKIAGQLKLWGNLNGRSEGISAFISSISSGIIYLYICLKALFGAFSIGSILLYTGVISRLTNALVSLAEALGELRYNAIMIKSLYDILDDKPEQYKGTIPVEKRDDNEYEIEFHNVSFRYPGSEDYAVRNLSLRLRVGQRLAVVGMNGSGKTTMIKLLSRLYDPTEGYITLNGIDIKKYDYDEYLGIFSVVFQDFRLFSFTLGENVAAQVDYDRERAEDCLINAGFFNRLKEMKSGLKTPLFKEFEREGVEISGGEAQKIALARALYKNAPFIILDEPTAALDPVSEYEIYKRFNDLAGDKTTIYISHRLSSCRFCDDIAVFHEGRLVQRGSHDELVREERSKYYELWHAQAQYYV